MKISYSRLREFLNCHRKYWYKYVEGIENPYFNINFFVGDVVNYGINLIYKKDGDFIQKTMAYADNKKQTEIRGALLMGPDDETKLYEAEYNIKGMLNAYANKYAFFLEDFTSIKSEYPIEYAFNDDTVIIGFIDNIFLDKKTENIYIHELKTTAQLTPAYVKSIQNDLQTALYYHCYNAENNDAIKGIFYDVIKKPSIRQKKSEDREQFLQRLIEWYDDNPDHFYMEPLDKPLLSKDRVWNILNRIIAQLNTWKTIDEFYPNDTYCNMYGKCDFYNICHNLEEGDV